MESVYAALMSDFYSLAPLKQDYYSKFLWNLSLPIFMPTYFSAQNLEEKQFAKCAKNFINIEWVYYYISRV